MTVIVTASPAGVVPDAGYPGLIADIGGTNVRFALVDALGGIHEPVTLKCADYASPVDAARVYLAQRPEGRPTAAVFAVASPITSDQVSMTNHPWNFSIAESREALGLERFEVINDFAAVAHGLPAFTDEDKAIVNRGEPHDHAPIALLGPGTGLGVSALVPSGAGRWTVVAGEGGHTTLPACDDREAGLIAWLRERHGHVSAERLLSGPGLVAIHDALRAMMDLPPESVTPADLSRRAAHGESLAKDAYDIFFALLGTFAGNVALVLGAKGGVVLAGGILPRVLPALLSSRFMARFVAKGRFEGYLRTVPVSVLTHPFPAFPGLARRLILPVE